MMNHDNFLRSWNEVPENESKTSSPESEPEAVTEPITTAATTMTSTQAPIPSLRPQPFRPRLYNKTKRIIHHVPLRERVIHSSPSNLSKRQTRQKRAIAGRIPFTSELEVVFIYFIQYIL